MSRNGLGTFSAATTFADGNPWTAAVVNAMYGDIGAEITNSLALDGQSTMTAPLKAANGTALLPAYTFGSDLNTGFYRIGADSIGVSVNGTLLVTFDSAGITLASGDILGTNIIGTTAIEDNAVTLAKLATQADATVLANVSGGVAVPSAVTYTAMLDDAFGTTQGAILYRGAAAWEVLSPGISGQFLKTLGAAANPEWATVAPTLSSLTGGAVCLQRVVQDVTSVVTLNTAIPLDNTIPQNTEGVEVLNQSITPVSASSYFLIKIDGMISWNAGGAVNAGSFALFQDSGANAIFAQTYATGTTGQVTISRQVKIANASLTAKTFKVRAGPPSGGSHFWLGDTSGNSLFGGVGKGSLIIEEWLAV